jgi:hypothetical protein
MEHTSDHVGTEGVGPYNAGLRHGQEQSRARIAELEAALRDVRAAIIEKAPDTLWTSLIETACDRIDGVLQPN